MRFPLSYCARAVLAALTLGAPVLPAAAQQYPARDIHIVNGYAAGSGADVIVRYWANKLQPLTGKSIIVENKPGAAGNIAMEAAARAKPDGYTVYMTAGSSMANSVSLFKNLKVEPVKDFTMVTTLLRLSFVLVVGPKSPAYSVADLTDLMKKKPDHGLYGATAPSGIVSAELYKSVVGLNSTIVNYKDASSAMIDLVDGSIDWMFMDPIAALEHMRAGKIRGLAVGAAERVKAIPELPSMAEAGVPGVDVVAWWAVAVPAGTPKPIVDQLATWFNRITETEESKSFINRVVGGDPFPGNPAMAQKLLETDTVRWRDYIRTAKIEPQG
jgi:tripartite-type tricarboxylate transporter receptor subunit TctC